MNNTNINHFRWYVVYTCPNSEKKVHTSLEQKNIISFLPLKKVTRQWSDRRKIIEIPLFPNYIFVYTTKQERFKVLDISGVSRYIMYNKCPATISENEITTLKKLIINKEAVIEQYLEGDKINIVDGPFNGLTGIIFERKGKTRFGVRLESINRSISVELNGSSIRKIDPHEAKNNLADLVLI
ncbi:MAG TPA: UpxY family transcription antiterminator [Chitinophagales bacterium]|nr:UpxY family transcription antiterminator [Chitinophagales bacterium]